MAQSEILPKKEEEHIKTKVIRNKEIRKNKIVIFKKDIISK